MVKITFLTAQGHIAGFLMKGHAGAGAYGSDPVCAAVSSAAYMAANTVTDVLGIPCGVSVSDGYFLFQVPQSRMAECHVVLKGLELHMRELAKQYPENLKIIYGGVSKCLK